jgi:type IV secretion system protein TrbI
MHSTRTEPTVSERDIDPVSGEANSYTPPNDVEPIALNTQKPNVKTLDKKKVAIIGATLSLAVLFAFVQAFTPNDRKTGKKEEAGQATSASRAENLNRLPNDYERLAEQRAQEANNVPQLGPPMPGELGATELAYKRDLEAGSQGDPALTNYPANTGSITPLQQQQQQVEMERLQRASTARSASTGFSSRNQTTVTNNRDTPTVSELPENSSFLAQAPIDGQNSKSRDDANRQDDKQGFLDSRKFNGAQLESRLIAAPGSFIGAGTIIPALFLTGINSDLPGMITAQVSQAVYDTTTGKRIVIPQGAVLIGEYDSRVTFGQSRVLLVWQRIRFPNGNSLSLEGMPGVDMSGYMGVSDKVNNHWGKLTASVVLSSVLAASAATTQGSTFDASNPSAQQQAAQGAGESINQAGQKLVDRVSNIQPTLEIRPGQRVAVMVSKDLILPTYLP